MAEDSYAFKYKALGLRLIFGLLRKDTASRRELGIQIQKLERMAVKFEKDFPARQAEDMPPAQLRKKKGPHLHRLTQQSKHVDALSAKVMEEIITAIYPNEVSRAQLKMLGRAFVKENNTNFHKQITENQDIARRGLAGLKWPALSTGKGRGWPVAPS